MERRQGLEQKLLSPEAEAMYPPGIWLALTGTIEDNRYPSAQTDLRMAVNNVPSSLSQLRVMLVASGTSVLKSRSTPGHRVLVVIMSLFVLSPEGEGLLELTTCYF